MAAALRVSRTTTWLVALVLGTLLIGGYFLFPAGGLAQSVYNNVISLFFLGLLVLGVRLHRPAETSAWRLFAGAILLSIVADSISTVYVAVRGVAPFPSVADVFYLAAYPLYFLGVARFGRDAAVYAARERRLDSLVVALGALTLSWQPLLAGYAHDSSLNALTKGTLIAYPVMDLVVLYIVVSALIFHGRWEPVDVLVGAAVGVMMAGDLTFDVANLHGDYSAGGTLDTSWMFVYLLLGVAALHPSMARRRGRTAAPAPRLWWLLMVGLATFVPAGALLLNAMLRRQSSLSVLALLALVMAMMAALRMVWMFGGLRERTAQLQTRTDALQKALAERDQLADALRHQAFHDPLTGVANRALLSERIEQALARSSRSAGSIALAICDLDGFKHVNDSLGHSAGDALLVEAATRLAAVVRPGDTVARLGGDEFAVLFDGVLDDGLVHRISDRIVRALHDPVDIAGDRVAVSVSVGVTLETPGSTAQQMLRDADAAMYAAKAQGRNRYVAFEPQMRSRAIERMQFTTAFADSIQRGEYELKYLPTYSLADDSLCGFEALVRWNHPKLGQLPPSRFLPLAEETGFIVALGRWVLETACREAARWPAGADGTPAVAVNVSATQLHDRHFARDVRHALALSGLPGWRLVLEVSEQLVIADGERTSAVLRELTDIGVRLAVADFGAGYSSLIRPSSPPIEFVKIGRTFVDDLCDDEASSRALVGAILRLAGDLGLTTVAEGIEAGAQRELLAALGCDTGQGYLLSRPLDATAAGALVRRLTAGASPAVRPAG